MAAPAAAVCRPGVMPVVGLGRRAGGWRLKINGSHGIVIRRWLEVDTRNAPCCAVSVPTRMFRPLEWQIGTAATTPVAHLRCSSTPTCNATQPTSRDHHHRHVTCNAAHLPSTPQWLHSPQLPARHICRLRGDTCAVARLFNEMPLRDFAS